MARKKLPTAPAKAPGLTHLFVALFRDGERYEQPPDDSMPDGADGSAYTYVARRAEEVSILALRRQSDGLLLSVDLDTGHFEFGYDDALVEFTAGDPGVEIPPGTKLTPLYFRRVRQNQATDVALDTMEQVGAARTSTDTEFHLGWSAVVRGKEVRHTIRVK